MSKQLQSSLILCLTAMIWGAGFIGQRIGMDTIGPFYFTVSRAIIAFIVVGFIAWLGDRKKIDELKAMPRDEYGKQKKITIIGGICCGAVLFFASNLQQVGLVTVDAGKAGFITALYIVLVPIFGIFLRHRTTLFNWLGAILGVAGLYLLCVSGTLSIKTGDLVILIGAVFWAMHILVTDHFVAKVNAIKLSAIQFITCGILTMIPAAVWENISWDMIVSSLPAILYCGVFSSGVAFTLQAVGQKHANPTVASVILSMESVWALIFGMIFLHEMMTGREFMGCAIMFAAVIIAQIPMPQKKK